MNIVLTGCGWLGMPLAEKLSKKGHNVIGTRRSEMSEKSSFPVFVFHPAKEIPKETENAFANADWIVIAFTPDRERLEAYSEHCLQVTKMAGEKTQILLVSSTSVYDGQLETATEDKADHSTLHKILLAEKALLDYCSQRLTIVRMAGLFGGERIIVNHMSRSGKTYNGCEPVNLIHQQDAVGICEFIIEENISGGIINACSGNHPLKREFYTYLAEKLGIAPPLFEEGPTGKIISSEKSRNLGYKYLKDDPYEFI